MTESLYVLPILLFSIVVHEVAHGWVAFRLGDPTARDAGRITLNPIPHIDPLGSVILPVLLTISHSPFFIGWAKPVPINPMYFRKIRRDDILVSIAGPCSNILMACCCTLFYIITVHIFNALPWIENEFLLGLAQFLTKMFGYGIPMNLFLALFNMLPVPPLDGSHVLASLLPERIGEYFRQIGFFGIIIVVILMRINSVSNFILKVLGLLYLPFDALIRICI